MTLLEPDTSRWDVQDAFSALSRIKHDILKQLADKKLDRRLIDKKGKVFSTIEALLEHEQVGVNDDALKALVLLDPTGAPARLTAIGRSDTRDTMRLHALDLLADLYPKIALPELERALRSDLSHSVREGIVHYALGEILSWEDSHELLYRMLDGGDSALVLAAVYSQAVNQHVIEAAPRLRKLAASHPKDEVRTAARRLLLREDLNPGPEPERGDRPERGATTD